MTKSYKILCSDELKTTYTFVKAEIPSVTTYALYLDETGGILFTAENHGNGIEFDKKIGKNFEYHEIAELQLFLNLIHKFDDGLTDTFDVFEKITTL